MLASQIYFTKIPCAIDLMGVRPSASRTLPEIIALQISYLITVFCVVFLGESVLSAGVGKTWAGYPPPFSR